MRKPCLACRLLQYAQADEAISQRRCFRNMMVVRNSCHTGYWTDRLLHTGTQKHYPADAGRYSHRRCIRSGGYAVMCGEDKGLLCSGFIKGLQEDTG